MTSELLPILISIENRISDPSVRHIFSESLSRVRTLINSMNQDQALTAHENLNSETQDNQTYREDDQSGQNQ